MWDEATEAFVARPAKVVRDRIDDILESSVIAALAPGLKTQLRTLIDAEFPERLRLYNVATGKDEFP